MKLLRISAAALLTVVIAFSAGCKSSEVAADADALLLKSTDELIEEGHMTVDEKEVTLSDELKAEFTDATFKFDSAPRVLIYHTHATEAFRMDGDYQYKETEQWRTDDNTKNVVYAGDVLAEYLTSLGFDVLHDTTNCEPPELWSAYSRSLEVMQSYDDIDIFIDLHRNAADVEKAKDDVAVVGGKPCARMFFVVGTGIGTYEGEYDVQPNWSMNYEFAKSVSDKLSAVSEELVLQPRVKVGRHNQHMGLCLLAEVGHNANTLDDVLNTLPYFAQALRDVCEFKQ